MKIYKLSTGGHSKYAYAADYHAFEGMAFIESVGEHQRKMIMDSWRIFPKEPGLNIAPSGSYWPDVMFCGNPLPSCFFSRKVLESLDFHRIAVKRAIPIPVGEVANTKLRMVPPPDYFVIEALPGIRVDYAASGFSVDMDGNPNRNAPRIDPPPILQYDSATWSGADLFCQANGHYGPHYLDLLGTERIKEIALKDGWTNVAFNRVRVKGVNPFTGLPE
ncbi:MAG TPA: hypothetical protein VF258_03285 [Luteolibacter sp.]